MIILIRHDSPFNEVFNSELFVTKMDKAFISLTTNNIQYYRAITVGWLLNAHVATMDYQLYTKALQYNSRFRNIPIKCKPIDYKSDPTYSFNKGEKRTVLAGIVTANKKKYIEATIVSCKDVFNNKTTESAKRRPQGTNVFVVDYNGESGGALLRDSTLEVMEEAFKKQTRYMKDCSVIYIQGIEDIDALINFNNDKITLLQVLTSLRTSTLWDTPLFTQVHFSDKHDEYIGICHNNERAEALLISCNIIPLCIAHFGDKARYWFEKTAIK